MSRVSAGDTAWILTAAALVLMMTPALAFFYGGMVRKKNMLSTINLSFVTIVLISIQWILVGYTLAFGSNLGGVIGSFKYVGLAGVGSSPNPAYAPHIPQMAFMAYEMMFAIITPALITGAFVERIKFKTFLVFTVIWATLIYDPVAHWVWGVGGFLHRMGVLDFGGGIVVHLIAGLSALAFAIVIGKRKDFGVQPMEPSNISYTVLGAGLLWMGWFGFNGGGAFAANGVAASALVCTNTSAAAAALVWMFLSWRDDKPSVLGIVTGAVVGLVAITPAAGYVRPWAAIIIGGVAGLIGYYAIKLIHEKAWIDESLDVFTCHGLGGAWGTLATGLFATKAVNGAGGNGLFYGNPGQFLIQLAAVAITAAFAFAVTWVIAKVLDRTMGLRVSENDEEVGLDISTHGERCYG